ncbi:MAG: DUF255 domain-containing protein [Candidatus Hermodarchaeia archaeon]|jgi:thioredoxin-related protein
MKKLLLAACVALLGCSPITVKHKRSAGPTATETAKKPESKEEKKKKNIDWQPFHDDLVKVSIALDKTVFVYIEDETCNVCEGMDKTTFSDDVIVDLINRTLIPTSIEINESPKTASIFYKGREITVPKYVFIRPQESGRWIVAEATGYKDSFEMLNLIRVAEDFIKEHIDEEPHEEGAGEPEGVPTE